MNVHSDFARQITVGDGCCHLRNISHLRREVAGHEVHGVGEILPSTGHAWDLCLPAQFAIRSHLASNARHFACERIQLIHHRVNGVL